MTVFRAEDIAKAIEAEIKRQSDEREFGDDLVFDPSTPDRPHRIFVDGEIETMALANALIELFST